MRVVSLVPSLTETAIWMGVTPVACTRFCEQPQLRHVGGTKNPDLDAVLALRPDVVLMDREENRREDAEALRSAGIDVHVTAVRSVADVAPMLVLLATRLAVRYEPVDPVEADPVEPDPVEPDPVEADPASLAERERTTCLTAFVPIWRRPWMTISSETYGSSLLAAIGVANVFAGHPDPYPTVTLDDVSAASPRIVLLPSEPYSFEPRHLDEIRAALPGVITLPIDGQDLFWWGARTASAVGRLRESIDQAAGSTGP